MWQEIFLSCSLVIIAFILRIYFRGSICKIERDLRNKIILITGGSKGIGQETIKQLSKYQCTIIFGCRNKPQQFLEQLQKTQKSIIKYIPLDLQDWQSINYFINEIKKEYNKIDILINNAAIMGTLNREYTKYGLESQFGTNYIGPFYLTQQLLPLLKQSQSPRVINVSSIAHTFEDLQLNDVNCDRWANSILWSRYYTYRAYGNTKLALILNSQEFSKRTGIKSCSLHPGVVRSDVYNHQTSATWFYVLLTIFWPIFSYFTKDLFYGCQTTLHCIMLSDDQLIDGGFYNDCKISKPKYTNPNKAEKLWDYTLALISEIENKTAK